MAFRFAHFWQKNTTAVIYADGDRCIPVEYYYLFAPAAAAPVVFVVYVVDEL